MNAKFKACLCICLLVLLTLLLTACSSPVKLIEGDARQQALAYTESKTDNLLTAIANRDYTSFSKDFNDAMLKAMTPDAFNKLCDQLTTTYGAYKSRSVDHLELAGQNIVVVYNAVFEKVPAVTIRVVFLPGEPHLISGLWFK
jgi:hypothetical protein